MHYGIRSEITRITPLFAHVDPVKVFYRSGAAQTDGQKRVCIEHRILHISVEYCLSFIGNTVFLIETYCRSTIFCSQKVKMVYFSLLASNTRHNWAKTEQNQPPPSPTPALSSHSTQDNLPSHLE